MAEDDRTIAEGSASRSLQGGMGLHLRGRCLQSGSLAESSDSSVVGQDRTVFVHSKNDLRAAADAAKDSSLSHRIETQGESESRRMFFRSLLKHVVPDLTLVSQRNGGKFPYQRVKEIIEGKEPGPLAHGDREMPIWGPIFHEVESDEDWGEVRLDAVTKHVESIQQK